jgi:uncharacterized protein with PQ loop repeat
MLLFLIFFPKPGSDGRPQASSAFEPGAQTWQKAVLAVTISLAHFFIVLMVSIVLLAAFPQYLQAWANILGIGAAALSMIQYLPQLWTTWHLQQVMSLSIPMMCIQTPGSFVFSASLAIRLGIQGWSAWGVYIVTGVLQGILLAMCISFELRDRKLRREAADTDHGNFHAQQGGAEADRRTTEQTPLLGSG